MKDRVWFTSDGEEVPLGEMTNRHLANTIRWLKKAEEKKAAGWEPPTEHNPRRATLLDLRNESRRRKGQPPLKGTPAEPEPGPPPCEVNYDDIRDVDEYGYLERYCLVGCACGGEHWTWVPDTYVREQGYATEPARRRA